MEVTVCGPGNMRPGFVNQLRKAGFEGCFVGRNADKAQQLAALHGARTVGAAEAAASDVPSLATDCSDVVPAMKSLDALDGEVVVDMTNPLTADFMGFAFGNATFAAEQSAEAVPEVRIVKAFDTVFACVLAEGSSLGAGKNVPVFAAGDDARAGAAVSELARATGFDVIDAGGLKSARYPDGAAGRTEHLPRLPRRPRHRHRADLAAQSVGCLWYRP